MPFKSPIAIHELVNKREVTEALNTLSRITGYKIYMMDAENSAGKAFILGKDLFEFDIYGYSKARVAFEPIAGQNTLGNFEDMVKLVRTILTQAYEIDDMAGAIQESSDQIDNLEQIAKACMISPAVDGIIEMFLKNVAELYKSDVAFIAISTDPTRPYTVRRLVAGKDVEEIPMTDEDTHALRALCLNLEREGEEFRQWRRDESSHILCRLLDNSQHDFFIAPITVAHQPLGIIGVSASIDSTATQQFLAVYMGVAVGAIAGAAWRQKIYEAEKAVIEAREEVARRVIHLMKNHLFAMKGSVNWIREISEEKQFHSEELDSAIGDLDQDLHDASKIISGFYKYIGTNQPELERVDINILLMPIVAEMRKAPDEDVVFEEQYAPELPEIQLDTALFKAIVRELIANANQHLDGKGRIRIRTAIASEAEKKQMNLPVDADFLAVEFADNGRGVPKENKERIFQMGFSTRSMGTGMGLALVKKYVEQHQGKIAEVGKEGEGATFLILLPIPEG